MRRTLLIGLGSSVLVSGRTGFAQQPQSKIARIGFLGATSEREWADRVEALRTGFRELGYVEGKNLVIEYRWAEGRYERLPELATELVRANVDIIVTHGTPGTRAARKATATVPIVMAASGDAVAVGLVASIARPGGNITGSTFFLPEISAKRLDMLKEAFPGTRRVAFIMNSDNPGHAPAVEAMESTARSLKMALQRFSVRASQELENAFSGMASARMEAVAIGDDSMLTSSSAQIIELAARYRIPAIGNRDFAERGGLMAYGASVPDMHRRAAYFADKILKGAKPGNLPIERATKFELIINMKAAKALGLNFPQSILVRADRVIE